MKRSRTRIARVLIAAPFIATGTVHAQETVDWKVGTKFTYVSRDQWKKETDRWEEHVTSKQGDTFALSVIEASGPVQVQVQSNGTYTRPKPEQAGGGTFSYVPVKLPLVEGAEWEWTYHYIGRSMGRAAQVTRKCKAGSLEDVTVPAGKFSARKIDCKGGWQSSAGSSGSSFSTVWYAPAVSAVVKRDEVSQYFGGRDTWTVVLEELKSE